MVAGKEVVEAIQEELADVRAQLLQAQKEILEVAAYGDERLAYWKRKELHAKEMKLIEARTHLTLTTITSTTLRKSHNHQKASPKAPDNAELAKWYGPDRRIYLLEGLLDISEVPAYLTGEVARDYGFDPFGLSKKPADFDKYQEYELIHTRWAMLGAAKFVLPEAFNKYGAAYGPEAVWFNTGDLLLDGGSIEYFGATVPISLAVAVIVAEVILVGGAKYYKASNLQGFDRLHPGGPFDPLGLAKDPDQFALFKVKEIKNGRLAMFSMVGSFCKPMSLKRVPLKIFPLT